MILVDTNVISELMKPAPSASVLHWLNKSRSSDLFVSAVTIGEIEFGLCILPDGARRADLQERFGRFIALAFASRVLSYGQAAAQYYGQIMARRRQLGRPISQADGQIAATARVADMTVATRNIRDFEQCAVELVDPFAVLA